MSFSGTTHLFNVLICNKQEKASLCYVKRAIWCLFDKKRLAWRSFCSDIWFTILAYTKNGICTIPITQIIKQIVVNMNTIWWIIWISEVWILRKPERGIRTMGSTRHAMPISNRNGTTFYGLCNFVQGPSMRLQWRLYQICWSDKDRFLHIQDNFHSLPLLSKRGNWNMWEVDMSNMWVGEFSLGAG